MFRNVELLILFYTAGSESATVNCAGLASQNFAAEVKIRAERGGGELLRTDPPKQGRPRKHSHDATVSLKDLGLTKDDSSRWQAIARNEVQPAVTCAATVKMC